MNNLPHFTEKIWTFVATIHPLVYVLLMLTATGLFFATKNLLETFRPKWKRNNTIAIALTIFLGLTVVGLILYFIFGSMIRDQSF